MEYVLTFIIATFIASTWFPCTDCCESSEYDDASEQWVCTAQELCFEKEDKTFECIQIDGADSIPRDKFGNIINEFIEQVTARAND